VEFQAVEQDASRAWINVPAIQLFKDLAVFAHALFSPAGEAGIVASRLSWASLGALIIASSFCIRSGHFAGEKDNVSGTGAIE